MTRSEISNRIKSIRQELEDRVKTGVVKTAEEEGIPIPTTELQNEMFSLIYKLSKME